MADEVMNLFHTVGALIAGESPQHDQDQVMPLLLGRHLDRFSCGSRKGKVRCFSAYCRSLRESGHPDQESTGEGEDQTHRLVDPPCGKPIGSLGVAIKNRHKKTLLAKDRYVTTKT